MKIYIMTDLEGVAGVVSFDRNMDGNESVFNLKHQQQARLLTGEVNAAVEGCFLAGASEVVVDDAHGGGYTLDFENIDKRAKVLHGTARPEMMAPLNSSFEAAVFIGAHAMVGSHKGILSHSMSSKGVRQIRINKKPIGEIGIFALKAGTVGVPMIFVSGDTVACREAKRTVKNIFTVSVKDGYSRTCALSLAPEKAREVIRDGVIKAIEQMKKVKPYRLKPPFSYQEDLWPEELKNNEQYASHPANLPKKWKTGPLVKAKSMKELLKKVYGRKV
ncbi:MAG: hypothetical protein A2044_03915 [Candidatus Firestonebacteria bacterium GWA2_43_8]|nr:MAG: hypothetical protein A2044_03915 [Candidatus Firestonebacteria bacterium GWA2_43_8]